MNKTQEIAQALRTREHVLNAVAIGNRITVVFPRERGGRSTMTLPQAKALLARLAPAAPAVVEAPAPVASFPTGTTTNPGRLYTASYPRMWQAAGPKCERAQYRAGRVTLYCCRPAGHDGTRPTTNGPATHLYDVHPTMQVGPLGEAARAAREAELRAKYEHKAPVAPAARIAEVREALDSTVAKGRCYAEAVTALATVYEHGDAELLAIRGTLQARLDAIIAERTKLSHEWLELTGAVPTR